MASLELCSQYDYAKKALVLYRKNEKSQNPFLLSLDVNAIEMLLKSIIDLMFTLPDEENITEVDVIIKNSQIDFSCKRKQIAWL